MIDTIEFKCPKTGERCHIVDGYSGYLMTTMGALLKGEEAVKARLGEDKMTLEAIAEWKGKVAEYGDLTDFAAEVSAAAHLQNCAGPLEATEAQKAQILTEPEHLMDLCPMVGFIFPSVD